MEEGREEHMQGDSLAENDESSYIEIELASRAAGVAPTCVVSSEEEDDNNMDNDEEEEDDELRISISSTIPIPIPDVHDQQCVVDYSDEAMATCSVVVDDPRPGIGSAAASDPSVVLTPSGGGGGDERRVKLPSAAFHRICNFNVDFLENRSSDHTHVSLQTTMPFNPSNHIDLSSSPRGKEGSMRRRNGGMIMKMLIKFRGIKLSALISSLIKPPRPPCQDHNNNKGHSRKYCRTILQCYHQKNMVVNPSAGTQEATAKRLSKPYWDLNNNNNNISSGSNEGSFRSSRSRSSWNRSVVEIDLGALKGMFSANSKRKSCSTVSSCDNSPIHEGFSFTCTADNSLQAAIAYCKTSFGQTSDFSF